MAGRRRKGSEATWLEVGRRASGEGRVAILLLLSLAALSIAARPAEDPTVRRGRALYEIHCQGCHGEDGRGAGPRAGDLTSMPADLTGIQAGRDGAWPRDELAEVIDGRHEIAPHGRREMPVWGLSFQNLERPQSQETEVEERIRALLAYLESIQERDE